VTLLSAPSIAPRERLPELTCHRCGVVDRPVLAWVPCNPPSEIVHLRADCASCGRFLKFVPQFHPWLEGGDMPEREGGRLRKVGALWKPKPGAKSLGSGSITVNRLRQRFVILKNEKKTPGSKEPDYVLMSSDEPEVDEYATKRTAQAQHPAPQPASQTRDEGWTPTDEDVPF
jgi:hypothetical protein